MMCDFISELQKIQSVDVFSVNFPTNYSTQFRFSCQKFLFRFYFNANKISGLQATPNDVSPSKNVDSANLCSQCSYVYFDTHGAV